MTIGEVLWVVAMVGLLSALIIALFDTWRWK